MTLAIFIHYCCLEISDSHQTIRNDDLNHLKIHLNFSGFGLYCLVFNVHCFILRCRSFLTATLIEYHVCFTLSITFFKFFKNSTNFFIFRRPFFRRLVYTITMKRICQQLFQVFLHTTFSSFLTQLFQVFY